MNNNRPDDDLRRLFAETTDGIRPLGTLDDIRTRTEKVDPMARRWFLPSIAAAAVMALVIGGAFWVTQNDDPALNPADNPSATVAATRAVPVYFVGDAAQGKRLFREFQSQPVCSTAECLMLASARTAVSGTPQDGDYTAPWPAGSTVESVTYDDDVMTIDLSGPGLQSKDSIVLPGVSAALAVEQLIYSAQAGLGQGRVPVQLLIDGNRTPTVLGVATNEPLAAAEELDVLAPVQISSPGNNQKFAPGDVTVKGVAAVFEANVTWELLVGGDAVVMSGFATADECCTMSPYEFTLEGLEPGAYTLVVHDEDMSGEGRPVNQDTKDIVVE